MIILLSFLMLGFSLSQGTAEVDPQALEWFRRGEDLIGTDLENSAEQSQYFEKAVELSPGFLPARYNLALVYIRQGRHEEALEELALLIESAPQDPRPLLLRARLRLEENQPRESVADLREAVRLDPENHEIWQLLGRARYQLQDYAGAAEAFQEVVRLRPDPDGAYFDLALSQHALGAREEAEGNYRRFLRSEPGDFQGNFLLARLYREMGRDESAREFFQAAEKIRPEDRELAQEFADLLMDLNELEAARERLLNSDLKLPVNLGNLGVIAMKTGDLTAARNYFRRSLAADPRDGRIWALLGDVLAERGSLEEAVDAYEKALLLRKVDFETLLALGTLQGRLDRWGDSVETLTKALSLRPDHGAAHFNLALALDETKDREGAELHYRKALELGAKQPYAHLRLMFLLAGEQKVREALEHMEAALAGDPGRYVRAVEEELRRVTSDLDSIRYTEEFHAILDRYRNPAAP